MNIVKRKMILCYVKMLSVCSIKMRNTANKIKGEFHRQLVKEDMQNGKHYFPEQLVIFGFDKQFIENHCGIEQSGSSRPS